VTRPALTTLDAVERACLAKAGALLDRPFGPDTLVIKVGGRRGGRMFALLAETAEPPAISLKCDPELSELLRAGYPAVSPGYHLDKRHWITVRLDGSLPDSYLLELIDMSYRLVFARLSAARRRALG